MNKLIRNFVLCVFGTVAARILCGVIVSGVNTLTEVVFRQDYAYIYRVQNVVVNSQGNWDYSLIVYRNRRVNGFTSTLTCVVPPGQTLKANDRIFIHKAKDRDYQSSWCSLEQDNVQAIKGHENE